MLRVACGPFSRLEEALAARIGSHPPGTPLAVVTPSRKLADRLERMLVLERGRALLNLRFHTFYSLALEVAEAAGPLPGAMVSDGLFHDKLIDKLLPKRSSRGLSGAYRATVRDLVDAGVEPASFRENFPDLLKDEAENARLERLFSIQEKYQRAVEQAGVLSSHGLARLATVAVIENRAPGLGRFRELYYYGFYDLTGTQADFFSAVAEAFPVVAFVPYRSGHPAFVFAKRLYDLRLHQAGAEPEHLPAVPGPAERLFCPGKTSPGEGPEVEVLSVSGARDEVWAAAKRILALAGRPIDPVPFRDIGIVARTLEPFRTALADILSENAIPYSMETEGPLLRHPVAKLALNLLTLRAREFPARGVLGIIESPYFKIERFRGRGSGAELAANWRRLAARLGVHSGWLQWSGKLGPWLERDLELYPRAVEEGAPGKVVPKEDAAELWRLLDGWRTSLGEGASWVTWDDAAARAKNLLEENFYVSPDDPGRAAWDAVLEAVESLKTFRLLGTEASWEEFLETFEEKLRRAALPGPLPNGGVRVLDAMDARGESFRHLFLIGLEEGLFPRQVREDPLLSDQLRRTLQDPAGYWIRPKLDGYDEERLLFCLLAGSASEGLHCVHSRSNEEGRPRVPSLYLRELCRAAGIDFQASVRSVPRQPLAKLRAEAPENLSPKEISLLMFRGGEDPGDYLAALGRQGELARGCLDRLSGLNARGEAGAFDGLVGRPSDYLTRMKIRGLSPTAVDTYARCPFRFFAGRLLNLEEAEEPTERGELSPWVRGQLYHGVLQRFHEELRRNRYWERPDPKDAWRAALSGAEDEIFSERAGKALGLYPVLWESARRKMGRHLERFAAWDVREVRESGLVPFLLESELSAEAGGVSLRGRPDRVDLGREGALRVIDYKSTWPSSGPALHKKVLEMKAHQPPLYLELAGRLPGVPSPRALGAFFYILEGEGKAAVQAFTAADWEKMRKTYLDRLGELVRQIEAGRFFIAPEEARGGACEYCSFDAVCRKAHAPSRRRAADSELRREYDRSRSLASKEDA